MSSNTYDPKLTLGEIVPGKMDTFMEHFVPSVHVKNVLGRLIWWSGTWRPICELLISSATR